MVIAIDELERRMRPGAWDTAGFLTQGQSLEAVLADDAGALAANGLDAKVLGERLTKLLDAGHQSDLGRPALVEGFRVEIRRQRGLITCPWAPEEFEACSYGRGANPTANRFLVGRGHSSGGLEGFELSVHLIRDHGFFGGPGTRFRLAPDRVAIVLTPN